MANTTNIREAALRMRAVVTSLTDPDDVAIVRDYLSELEFLAAQQEAEDARLRAGLLH